MSFSQQFPQTIHHHHHHHHLAPEALEIFFSDINLYGKAKTLNFHENVFPSGQLKKSGLKTVVNTFQMNLSRP